MIPNDNVTVTSHLQWMIPNDNVTVTSHRIVFTNLRTACRYQCYCNLPYISLCYTYIKIFVIITLEIRLQMKAITLTFTIYP